MKKNLLLALFILTAINGFAQKREKIKGSRAVTVEQKEIGNFENIEIDDNIEVFLTKGDRCEFEIEADDNVHDAIDYSISSGTLRISTNKDVTSTKKFSVKVTYTDDLKMLIAKDETHVTGLTDLNLDDFTIKASGSAKVYTTVKSKMFTLMANDKAKVELNLTAANAAFELNKNSQLKALVSSPKLKFDMYQKASATVEGDVIDLRLRLDNNTNFTGKNLTAKNAEIITEGSTNGSVAVTGIAVIDASGKSEIELHGDQTKIEIRKFTDNATIRKKSTKVSK